jgi:ActR/RegA family two-component response regulator
MSDSPKRDWKTLAEMVTREQDPAKLLKIARELNAALLERERANRGSHPRVLVVDDDESVQQTLVPVLQKKGYAVKFADTVPTAISVLENDVFDALVCDLNLAQTGDGFTVVTAMREVHPRSVIVLLTGYPGFESAVAGIRQAVDDYLVKPADYDVLLRVLEERLKARFTA